MTIVEAGDKPIQACLYMTHLFFSPEDDGRLEVGRLEREAIAKGLCMTCVYRIGCLEKSVVWKEEMGVWGGMGEGERRRFVTHLKSEGYRDEVPTGAEFKASLRQFYQEEGKDAYKLVPRTKARKRRRRFRSAGER